MVNKIKEQYAKLDEAARASLIRKLKDSGEQYGVYPLTDMQESLLYAYLTEPEDTSYQIKAAILFRGEIDLSAVKRTLRTLIVRHPAFRTKLLLLDDARFQCIEKPYEPEIAVITTGRTDHQDLLAIAEKPFDLEAEYPFRFYFVQDESRETQILLMSAHHLYADGFSFSILIEEFCKIYAGKAPDGKQTLTPYPLLYGKRTRDAAAETYWKEYLKDFRSPIRFADTECTDKTKAACEFPLGTVSGIERAATEADVSVYAYLLGAYLDALHQYSHAPTASTAVAVLNRTTAEEMQSVGLYAALLPVFDRANGCDLGAFLQSVKLDLHRKVRYSRISQRTLLDLLMQQGTAEELYRNVFLFNEDDRSERQIPDTGLTMQVLNIENSSRVQYQVLVSVVKRGTEYIGHIDYQKTVVSAEKIESLAGIYQEVVSLYLTQHKRPETEFKQDDSAADAAPASQQFNVQIAEQLRKIWAELLGNDTFSDEDNFFATGGNSLLAIKLLKRMNETMGAKIKMTDIFRYHSIHDMAVYLEKIGG